MMDDLKQLFDKARQRSEHRARKSGLVGKHNADTTVDYAVPGKTDTLYVTLPGKTVIIARNEAGVPQVEDYPVLLERDKQNRWKIVGRDTTSTLAAPSETPPSGVLAHGLDEHTDVTLTTPATGEVLTYDGTKWINDTAPGAAVTSVNGQTGTVVLDQDDVGDGTTYKQYSATEKTKLAGIEAGADVTDAGNIASSITGVSTDDTIADTDVWGYLTSGALVKTTFANIKAVLKTYFDTLYNLYVHPNHTGDVTSAGDGATTIGASKVLTSMIANDAVTFAKMQNIATDSLVGRDTASSGDAENILLNATLSMDGAGNLQRAALTGDVTASAGSNTTAIASNAVVTSKIADANVTNAKLADMVQSTLKGRAAAAGTGVPTDLSKAQVLTLLNVADGANAYVHPNHTGDVTSTGDGATVIGSNKVLTAMIADAQITLAKMANLAQATIIGRASGAGTGVPTALSAAQVVAIIQSSIDHGGIGGLGDDDHSGYLWLLGRSGGQTVRGGTGSGENLTLMSTSNGAKGDIIIGTSYYDEVNNWFGIGLSDPGYPLDVLGRMRIRGSGGAGGGFWYSDSGTTDKSFWGRDVAGWTGLFVSALSAWPLVITDAGDVGISTTSPQAKLHAHQSTLGGAVQRLSSTATNDDPTEIVTQGRVATTNATVTTIETFTLAANTTYQFDMRVVARRTGGSAGTAQDSGGFYGNVVAKGMDGVTAALLGGAWTPFRDVVGWDVSYDVTGNTMRIRVTGVANTNISWHSTTRMRPVSS